MTWSDKVKARDGNKCMICGSTENLQAHHIRPGFLYPELHNDVDNGITLCPGCHQKQHGGHFAGYNVLPVNGQDPDPEGRMQEYMKKRKQEEQFRKDKYFVWASDKHNSGIISKAAEASGQTPKMYIAEAIFTRLMDEGFATEKDNTLFVAEWRW